ncbi:hypothetical protein ACHAXN_001589, partial [Cyclotella atomus]
IDAATVPPLTLSREIALRRRTDFSNHLDFVNTPDSKIKSLFYDPSRDDSTSIGDNNQVLFPHPYWQRMATRIRKFFELALSAKKTVIEGSANYMIDKSNLITYLDSPFASDGNNATNDTEYGEDDSIKSDAAVDFPMDQDEPSTESKPKMCTGIDEDYISNMFLDAEKRKERPFGFSHTVHEGLTTSARLEHPDNIGFKLPFDLPVCGFLTHGNQQDKIVWKVHQKARYVDTNSFEDGPSFGCYSIHHAECVGGAIVKEDLCKSCYNKKKRLIERFDSHHKARTEGIDINTRSNLPAHSHSLQQQVTEHYKKQAKNLSARLSYKQRALDKLTEEQGMTVEINDTSDSIFNYNVANNVTCFLASDPNDRCNAIADFVFRESVKKYFDAKERHASGVRHSPLAIRLGALIYSKLKGGGDLYQLVAKIMGLPSDHQIRRYKHSTVNSMDGFLYLRQCQGSTAAV